MSCGFVVEVAIEVAVGTPLHLVSVPGPRSIWQSHELTTKFFGGTKNASFFTPQRESVGSFGSNIFS